MSKIEADGLKQIRISELTKDGYFSGYRQGHTTWTQRWSKEIEYIDFEVVIPSKLEYYGDKSAPPYMRLRYTQTDENGKAEEFDYEVKLTTTPCKFGGERYWFVCRLITDKGFCSRRVGVLYKGEKYFGCRHCYNLTYASRNLGGSAKATGKIIPLLKLWEIKDSIKRKMYNGRLTKRYVRYLEQETKTWGGLYVAALPFSENLGHRGHFFGRMGKLGHSLPKGANHGNIQPT